MSKTVLFQVIQFIISTQLSSILHVGRTYQVLPLHATVDLGAMTMKGYFTFPKAPAIRLFGVIYQNTCWDGGGLTPLKRGSQCILQPQPTRARFELE